MQGPPGEQTKTQHFTGGSSFISVVEALPADTLEELCQTGTSKHAGLPRLPASRSPCHAAAASPPKHLLPQNTAMGHTSACHPVLTASLHKQAPQHSRQEQKQVSD